MNRRGFISLLAGSAGAVLVPWRRQVEPVISLPPRNAKLWTYGADWGGTVCTNSNFSNEAAAGLTQQSLEEMLQTIRLNYCPRYQVMPRRLIVSPQVKQLIDTDPVIRRAAEMALRGEYLPEELGLYGR